MQANTEETQKFGGTPGKWEHDGWVLTWLGAGSSLAWSPGTVAVL